MARKKTFKCSRCGKSFSMAAHLGRHTSTIHASPQKKAAAKRKRAAKKRAAPRKKRGKKRGVKKAKNGRRRKRTASTRGLRNMSVEALSKIIADARAELRRKVAEIQKAMK